MRSTAPENSGSDRIVRVAVAVIKDAEGRVLLSRRAQGVHQGGLWELPGGKLEPGETTAQALRREIREELGLEVIRHRPLIRVAHRYVLREVLLDVHLVTEYAGIAEGLEGQPLAWVRPGDLHLYPLPEADRPILKALDLPVRYLITADEVVADRTRLLRAMSRALEAGERLFQIRAKSLPMSVLVRAARDAIGLCREPGGRVLVNADPALALELGADGVHLDSRRLMGLGDRPLGEQFLVAASCHGEAELRQAERIGADFAVLSPVLATASHPDLSPLGWERFAVLVEMVRIPVYALGGMHLGLLERAWGAGAQGVAGIGGLWPAQPVS
jgi:8-oxo-dGTP diphosphatase